jgi:hypothetical protein
MLAAVAVEAAVAVACDLLLHWLLRLLEHRQRFANSPAATCL